MFRTPSGAVHWCFILIQIAPLCVEGAGEMPVPGSGQWPHSTAVVSGLWPRYGLWGGTGLLQAWGVEDAPMKLIQWGYAERFGSISHGTTELSACGPCTLVWPRFEAVQPGSVLWDAPVLTEFGMRCPKQNLRQSIVRVATRRSAERMQFPSPAVRESIAGFGRHHSTRRGGAEVGMWMTPVVRLFERHSVRPAGPDTIEAIRLAEGHRSERHPSRLRLDCC